jgi:WD40 repeat protein
MKIPSVIALPRSQKKPDGLTLLRTLCGHTANIYGIAFSPDGNKIVSGSLDGTNHIWDTVSRATLATLKEHLRSIYSVCFSPDGKQIASAGYNNKINLWDIQSNKLLHILEGHTSFISSCAPTNKGKVLISKSNIDIRFWRTDTWQTVGIGLRNGCRSFCSTSSAKKFVKFQKLKNN